MSNYTPDVNTPERRSCTGLRCNTPAQQAALRLSREQKATARAQRIAADLEVEERRSELYRQRQTDAYQAQRQAALVAGGATWRAFVDSEIAAERAVYDV